MPSFRTQAANMPHGLPCVGCGYSLRGLDPAGVCPECGTSIHRSIHGDRLAMADPDWLRRVVRGQSMVAWGFSLQSWAVVGYLLLLLLAIFLLMLLEVASSAFPNGISSHIEVVIGTLGVVLIVGTLCGLALCMVGAFALTSLEPRESLRESKQSRRVIVRWGTVALVAAGCVVVAVYVTGISRGGIRLAEPLTAGWGVVALMIMSQTVQYVGELGQRIPAPELTTASRKLVQRLRVLAGLLAAITAVRFLAPARPGGGVYASVPKTFVNCGSLIFLVLWIGALSAATNLMMKYRREFKLCLAMAGERNPTNEPPPTADASASSSPSSP